MRREANWKNKKNPFPPQKKSKFDFFATGHLKWMGTPLPKESETSKFPPQTQLLTLARLAEPEGNHSKWRGNPVPERVKPQSLPENQTPACAALSRKRSKVNKISRKIKVKFKILRIRKFCEEKRIEKTRKIRSPPPQKKLKVWFFSDWPSCDETWILRRVSPVPPFLCTFYLYIRISKGA